jgi:Tol biopolymer transport system component
MKSRLLLVFVAITVLAGPTFAQKRNITEKDLFNFVWIADPQVSPDGSRIAFSARDR